MKIRDLHKGISVIASSITGDAITKIDDDDCAVLRWEEQILIVTTDFINSSPAIVELGKGSWFHLGQLAACHNFADLAGSGCIPHYYLSGICVPRNTTSDDVLEFTKGVCEVCKQHQCILVGGDTKIGGKRSIYGTAIGSPIGTSGPFLRTSAKPGYKIVVSSPLGRFAAAVLCLGKSPENFSDEERLNAQNILLQNSISFDICRKIASFGTSCAGTDISDGLGTDLNDICQSSQVSAVIDKSQLPIDDFAISVASRLNLPPWTLAFACGGDFACIYGVAPEVAQELASEGIAVIGEFMSGPPRLISATTGRPMLIGGHQASRTKSFADEIYENAQEIVHQYDNRT